MNNIFKENLKKIRKENNISQEQLAEELGVSRQAISKWESGVAYPEMDKIISLCDKFNLNIDDLLHKDINDMKEEEETKKNINKYANSFLTFITDSINLFSNMSFKSKLKFILEEIIIIFILIILMVILYNFSIHVISGIFQFLPNKIYMIIYSIFKYIILLFLNVVALVIFIHIFKTRYLDYYNKLKNNFNNINNIDELDIDKQNKILLKSNENKIIIRDPKNTQYNFINSLIKFIVTIIKIILFCFSIFLCLILIGIVCFFTLSFLLYKTGIFFIGLIGISICIGSLNIIFILIIFNFVFNRKSNKKLMIWTTIYSLIIFGVSLGLIFIGSLNFDIVNDKNKLLKTDKIHLEMDDNMFFESYRKITYIEDNRDNIEIEYKICKYCYIDTEFNHGNEIYISSYCPNSMGLIKEFINNLNNKKIITINDYIEDIKIYASKENIDKLKNNRDKYYLEY